MYRHKKAPIKRSGRWYAPLAGMMAVVLIVGVIAAFINSPSKNTTPQTLAQLIDGIPCQAKIQSGYQATAQLSILYQGKQEALQPGVGVVDAKENAQGAVVSGKCYYWLHTLSTGGEVDIDAPSATTFYLGELFDIWGQPLSSTQIGGVTGTVTAYLNGNPWSQIPALMPLANHDVLQLDIVTAGSTPSPSPSLIP